MQKPKILKLVFFLIGSTLLGYSLWRTDLGRLGRALWSWEILLPVLSVLVVGTLLMFYLYRGYFMDLASSFPRWLFTRLQRLFKKETPDLSTRRISGLPGSDGNHRPAPSPQWRSRPSVIPTWLRYLLPLFILGAFTLATYRILDRFFDHLERAGAEMASDTTASASLVVIVALLGLTFPVGWLFVRLSRQIEVSQGVSLSNVIYSDESSFGQENDPAHCRKRVELLLREGHLDEALKIATACLERHGMPTAHLSDELTILYENWNALQEAIRTGRLTYEEAKADRNQILARLLAILKELEKVAESRSR